MGRVSRGTAAWAARLALAEALGARVATDLKVGAAFPTDHKLHVGAPAVFPGAEIAASLRDADVVLSLDWVDLGGTLRAACGGLPPRRVLQVSLDHQPHNSWSMDYPAPPAGRFPPPPPPRTRGARGLPAR